MDNLAFSSFIFPILFFSSYKDHDDHLYAKDRGMLVQIEAFLVEIIVISCIMSSSKWT
jgi:hypothetical protein